ncbi:hypothetical protein D3C84_1275140 [compost metagenome]
MTPLTSSGFMTWDSLDNGLPVPLRTTWATTALLPPSRKTASVPRVVSWSRMPLAVLTAAATSAIGITS